MLLCPLQFIGFTAMPQTSRSKMGNSLLPNNMGIIVRMNWLHKVFFAMQLSIHAAFYEDVNQVKEDRKLCLKVQCMQEAILQAVQTEETDRPGHLARHRLRVKRKKAAGNPKRKLRLLPEDDPVSSAAPLLRPAGSTSNPSQVLSGDFRKSR